MPRIREDDQREDQAEQERPTEHGEDLDAAVGGEAEPARVARGRRVRIELPAQAHQP